MAVRPARKLPSIKPAVVVPRVTPRVEGESSRTVLPTSGAPLRKLWKAAMERAQRDAPAGDDHPPATGNAVFREREIDEAETATVRRILPEFTSNSGELG